MSRVSDIGLACPSAMTIHRAGIDIVRARDDIASGPFLVQMLLSSEIDGEMTAMRAYFESGVVTHWHSHPRGQLLFVLDGVGLVQRDGGEVTEVRVGDSVWFAPDERHWHGATPSSPFSYLSVQPIKDSAAVHWMEPVDASVIRATTAL